MLFLGRDIDRRMKIGEGKLVLEPVSEIKTRMGWSRKSVAYSDLVISPPNKLHSIIDRITQ